MGTGIELFELIVGHTIMSAINFPLSTDISSAANQVSSQNAEQLPTGGSGQSSCVAAGHSDTFRSVSASAAGGRCELRSISEPRAARA